MPFRILLCVSLFSTACHVAVYQPLVGLGRPVLVNVYAPNFVGLRVVLTCTGDSSTKPEHASVLCSKLSGSLTSQGALVSAHAVKNDAAMPRLDEANAADLYVRVQVRQIRRSSNALLTYFSYVGTLSLVPTTAEVVAIHDVSIYDARGFLLATRTLKARIIEHIGAGYWMANWVLDKFFREPSEVMGNDAAKREYSVDLYQQLSQLVHSAHVRKLHLIDQT